MARMTRSKKINIAEDHTALGAHTSLLASSYSPAAGEFGNTMTANNISAIDDRNMASELKSLKAAWRGTLGIGKRGKNKKNKKNIASDSQEELAGVAEGQDVSAGGPEKAVFTTPIADSFKEVEEYQKENVKIVQAEVVQEPVVHIGRTTRQQAARAQAAEEALLKLGVPSDAELVIDTPTKAPANCLTIVEPNQQVTYTRAQTPSKTPVKIAEPEQKVGYASVQTPLRSPVKTLEEVETEYKLVETPSAPIDTSDDSFVEAIISRSPAKPVLRIEDSVEALDKLEEALEAIDQATLAEKMVSAEKRHRSRDRSDSLELIEKNRAEAEAKLSGKPIAKQPGLRAQSATRPGFASMRVKSTASKTSVLKKAASMTFRPAEKPAKVEPPARTPVKRPASLMPPKETVKSTKPPTRPTFELPGEAVARRLKEQREARLAQRESSEDPQPASRAVSGPKIKSTKAPTKPTFELPGEALSRRKREAHEARVKAQEEEERKRREFKAKPIRKSIVPSMVPRETVASRARQNKFDVENIEDGNLSVSKRTSNVGAHRPSLANLAKSNSSAPRVAVPPPIRKQTPTTHGPSMSGRAMQRTVSTSDAQQQRQRAKEIYNRDAKMSEDMEREKREREAAAKRAREEAAERGRQASREWAEKQMAKKMHEGDKGLGAGYGAGGQLGLTR